MFVGLGPFQSFGRARLHNLFWRTPHERKSKNAVPTMAPKEEKQSSNVFILDKEFGWRPAVQEKVNGDTAIVTVFNYPSEQAMQCDGGRGAKGKGERQEIKLKDYANQVLPLQNVDANGNLTEFPDMVKLPYLHEVRRLGRCTLRW